MASFQYKSLNKHLESRGHSMGLIANHILRTAQDNAEDGEIDIAAEDIPYEYDFLEDRWLIAEMLAERPEVAFVKAQTNGFKLWLSEPVQEMKIMTQAELDAIYQRHQKFFENEPDGKSADFSGMVLLGLEMRGMDFSYANFDGAVLKECDMSQGRFEGCTFKGTAFESVQAVKAVFEQSDFTGARLEGGNFFYANFENSNFSDAVFDSVSLDHTNLDCCDFARAKFEDTSLRTASTTLAKGLMFNRPDSDAQRQLEIAHAKHTLWRLDDPDGEMAVFTCMRMEKLDFSGKNFDGAIFQTADLSRCDLTGCSLIGVDFTDAVIEGCDFTGSQCQDAEFVAAQLYSCDFTDAELDDTDFSQAEITNCEGLEDISQGPAMEDFS